MASTSSDPILANLSREEALSLTQNGGTIRCLDVPLGTEFGIDLRAWAVGPLFGGVKMLPTDNDILHFVTWGSELACCGTFIKLRTAEVAVMRWGRAHRSTRLRGGRGHNTRTNTAGGADGARPLARAVSASTAAQWRALTCHLSDAVLERAGIPLRTATAPAGIDEEELRKEIERLQQQNGGATATQANIGPTAGAPGAASDDDDQRMAEEGEPVAAQFVMLDPRRSGKGLSGAALSRFHLDRTEWLELLLTTDYGSEDALLGELQLSFILFLRLASMRALEQWKALLQLLCACEEAVHTRPSLYAKSLATLRAQLELATADFFEGDGEHFLRACLAGLAENTGESDESRRLDPALSGELQKLWSLVEAQFGLSRDGLVAAAFDEDDEPVVVGS